MVLQDEWQPNADPVRADREGEGNRRQHQHADILHRGPQILLGLLVFFASKLVDQCLTLMFREPGSLIWRVREDREAEDSEHARRKALDQEHPLPASKTPQTVHSE